MRRLGIVDRVALVIGRGVVALLGLITVWQVVLRLVRKYLHFPAPAFISAFLDSPLRRAMQPPSEVVARAGVKPGMTVLELGCGPGTFTVEASRWVQPGGTVMAVDIQPRMLDRLRAKLARLGVENVKVYQAGAYDLPLEDASVDLAFMVTVLAEIPDRQRALAELRRVLKPGGTLAVSEFILDPDYPRRSTVEAWCRLAGFVPIGADGGLLWYVASFLKPAQ